MNEQHIFLRPTVLAVIAALMPVPSIAAGDIDALKETVESLQKQLEQVQKQLKEQEEAAASKQDVQQLQQEVAEASEWRDPNTLIHMAGYADAGYVDAEGEDGSFTVGRFAPIFHFQYRDLVMLESELEITQNDTETDVALEYLTLDYFYNDYVTVLAGKFLSPVGQFRQNLHPSWINKLPSAPPGFGHDGAAPVSELGIQLRGGFPLGSIRTNYALYVGNGPELKAEAEGAAGETEFEYELDGIDAEAFSSDGDGEKVFGGRIGIIPVAGLEIGLSGATGKATITELEAVSIDAGFLGGTAEDAEAGISNEPDRDYDVYGADFALQWRNLDTRGEYVKSKVGNESSSAVAEGAEWESWYLQAAYRLRPTKWEGVVRYTEFDSPHDSADQDQWAVGVNYLFSNNFIGKLSYEFNDGQNGSTADDDRFFGQMAYGF
ncbi:MAG: hypothetical protein J5I92_17345 [Thiogranum sp.]|nr:hypothetical protein [Thiogranum sp.]